jgi:hypothetical protein
VEEEILGVDLSEPRMREDLLNSSFRAQPLIRMFVQQLTNDVLCIIGVLYFVLGFVREYDSGLLDFEKHHVSRFVVERGHSNEHLVDENA